MFLKGNVLIGRALQRLLAHLAIIQIRMFARDRVLPVLALARLVLYATFRM
jgi:hypothetical protein